MYLNLQPVRREEVVGMYWDNFRIPRSNDYVDAGRGASFDPLLRAAPWTLSGYARM